MIDFGIMCYLLGSLIFFFKNERVKKTKLSITLFTLCVLVLIAYGSNVISE